MFVYRQDKSGDWTVRMSNPDCTLQVCVVTLLKQLRISFWTPHPFVTVLQTAFSIFANDAKKKVRPGAAACSCEGAWWCFSEDFISTSQGMHDNALYPNICRNVTFISTRSQWSWRKDAVVTQRILSCWVHVNLWCYNINAQRQAMSYSACSWLFAPLSVVVEIVLHQRLLTYVAQFWDPWWHIMTSRLPGHYYSDVPRRSSKVCIASEHNLLLTFTERTQTDKNGQRDFWRDYLRRCWMFLILEKTEDRFD